MYYIQWIFKEILWIFFGDRNKFLWAKEPLKGLLIIPQKVLRCSLYCDVLQHNSNTSKYLYSCIKHVSYSVCLTNIL